MTVIRFYSIGLYLTTYLTAFTNVLEKLHNVKRKHFKKLNFEFCLLNLSSATMFVFLLFSNKMKGAGESLPPAQNEARKNSQTHWANSWTVLTCYYQTNTPPKKKKSSSNVTTEFFFGVETEAKINPKRYNLTTCENHQWVQNNRNLNLQRKTLLRLPSMFCRNCQSVSVYKDNNNLTYYRPI